MADGNPDLTTTHNIPLPQPKTTRRRFLIGGAAGVGLLIGYLALPRTPQLVMMTQKDETVINAWLKVGADGRVVVLVPQAEMGQGVYTALPQILAEELGAAWESISVEPAPVHPIYANTLVMQEGTEVLPGFAQGIARWAMAELAERLALQITGGSTSVRAFYDTLRLAGATARTMLCMAAGRRWGVDWTECVAQNSMVVSGNRRASFAELAADAAKEQAPDTPQLHKAQEFKLIGHSVPRIDIPSKVDGTARFGADVRLAGMAYAAVMAGPQGTAPLIELSEEPLADAKGFIKLVRQETWVAVVADSWWRANTLLASLEPQFDVSDAGGVATVDIDAAIETALKQGDAHVYAESGDVEDALSDGGVVERSYSVPYLAHACMEPMTATARVSEDRVEVWAPTQSVTWTMMAVAKALGVSRESVTVYPTLLGGGFGRKIEADAAVQAAIIAREAGRPVQLVWSREEDIRQDKYRPAAKATLRGRVEKGGRIAAWYFRSSSQSVQGSVMGRIMPLAARSEPDFSSIQGAIDLPYKLGDTRIEHVAVEAPVPVGYWRSVGHSINAFFVESFIDELAEAAGMDPLAFRLKALEDSPRHAAVLKRVAAMADFGTKLPQGQGRGIALHESFGSIVAQVAHVAVEPDDTVRVLKVFCVIDCGRVINPDVVRAQMESGILFGLTATLFGEVTFADGLTEQTNFDGYPLLTLADAPEIEVDILNPNAKEPGGVGEPGVPPIAPAVVNAIARATGTRVRNLPVGAQQLWPPEVAEKLRAQAEAREKAQAEQEKAAREAEQKKAAEKKATGPKKRR
ncbi:xanthine dehydrogenase family protein molybdopterin-binding subunit [Pedomonas mirosovicensis]|uniref:xanthine dehydrogenase family protein molybdopterin-binding subunit n=1 Tax=Pedomonas mirosovicensis TaxID=2908641 RepID=UPI002168E0ED|nr:molybdopterin cofactor-binding domain-containing protein [Pedomonas mirosovicensis]MCH8685965.1 molybdopterin-dependent oxidoreductase [Pedomonas mirosovicensis]